MVRLKSRYILFEIVYPGPEEKDSGKFQGDKIITVTNNDLYTMHKPTHSKINARWILNEIRSKLLLLYGEFGLDTSGSPSSLSCKYFSNSTSSGILKCSRDSYEPVIGALVLIDNFNGVKGIIRTCCVSGSIKKCEDASIIRSKQMIMNLK